METYSMVLGLCERNPLVTCGFPSRRPVTQSFHVFFDLCLNKWLCKQLRHPWFEMPSHSLWCRCNVIGHLHFAYNFRYSIQLCLFIHFLSFSLSSNVADKIMFSFYQCTSSCRWKGQIFIFLAAGVFPCQQMKGEVLEPDTGLIKSLGNILAISKAKINYPWPCDS